MATAARQSALITTEQLIGAGIGRGAIAHRVAEGRLTRLHRGVYLVGPLAMPRTPEMAALLTCGFQRSALSHLTAAAVWGLRAHAPATVDVTVAAQVRSRPGLRAHRTKKLHPHDVTSREGLRLTTPARTLIDLAGHLPASELDRAIEEAQVRRLITPAELALLPSRSSNTRGTRRLKQALERAQEPSLTRSEAERRLLDLIRAARLSHPRTNARVGPYEVDFLWPAQRLVVEVDGYAFHSSRAAFERDRMRDAQLQAAGHRVMRVTWRQLAGEPEALIARLAGALAAR